ncbi:hypothetical protein N6G96_03970 [Pediococcus inopinatus]|uniref:Polysaccharide polymerase n=1 Tax=Pediococcus inopinatus TaxID=114090 RepID=A0ABZ0Q6Q9_9LACO|nr:hypothetical protein [Pediococcus inopinatus]WPC22379.1 hypothetical protein N6G96_03970 [Pediococcus inopinatus]
MKKKILAIPLIFLVVIAYYLSSLVGISIDTSNIIVVIAIYACVVIALFSKTMNFKREEVFLILIQLAIAVVALKANMVSLTVIVLLNAFFSYYNSSINLNYFTRISFLLFMITVISYYFFGFNSQYDISMWRINGLINRSSIGFTQPNQAMLAWVGIFFGFILNMSKKNRVGYIFLLLGSITVYIQTKSRTGFVILLSILTLTFLLRNCLDKPVSRLLKSILIILPTSFFGVSIWLMNQSTNNTLNSLLSGRPMLYKQFFDLTGITLWGNSVIENKMLDNSYLSMLLGKGIVFSVFYIITLIYLIMSAKKLSVRLFIVISLFFVYGLTETLLFRFELLLPIIMSLHVSKEEIDEKSVIPYDS